MPLYVILGILLVAILGVVAYVLTQGSSGDGPLASPTPELTTTEPVDPTPDPVPDPDPTDEPTNESVPGDPPPFPDSFAGYSVTDQNDPFHREYAGPGANTYVWLHTSSTVAEASVDFDLEPLAEWLCGPGIYTETSCFIETLHGALEVYQYETPPNEQVHAVAVEFHDAWLN